MVDILQDLRAEDGHFAEHRIDANTVLWIEKIKGKCEYSIVDERSDKVLAEGTYKYALAARSGILKKIKKLGLPLDQNSGQQPKKLDQDTMVEMGRTSAELARLTKDQQGWVKVIKDYEWEFELPTREEPVVCTVTPLPDGVFEGTFRFGNRDFADEFQTEQEAKYYTLHRARKVISWVA
ncbi:hypothetical protein [Roseibium sp.]|uniref:hypothetical protein n=1 Tax=Roseibium sp. TaxID=1936156 RepID=UPI003A97AD8E